MIKIVDVDKLFDKYISDYVYKNIGKVKPEEIEKKVASLYIDFGKEKIKELDNMTPEEYYKSFSGAELIQCLKTHLEKGVGVSDFLCEALTEGKKHEKALLDAINDDSDEEFMLYIMNMLNEIGSENCKKRYIELVTLEYSAPIKELATEYLKDRVDSVREDILNSYKDADENAKMYLTEILSCSGRDDRVFDILVAEFAKHGNNIPLYASYLSKYGDERAIPFLMRVIEDEKIRYSDFEELRFAIEALGGEYTKKRDFSKDMTYKKIKGEGRNKPKII